MVKRSVILLVFVLLLLLPFSVHAAVTLKYFRVAAVTSSSVKLEWETATELDHAMFALSRADSENGEYQTLETFPAEGDAVSGAYYSYTDTSVLPGNTYWYKLEDLDIHGNLSEAHAPISVYVPNEGEQLPTSTPTLTPTSTPTLAPGETPTETPTNTPVATRTSTPTPLPTTTSAPTKTSTPKITRTPTSTPISTFTPTKTPVPTNTPPTHTTPTQAPPTPTTAPGVSTPPPTPTTVDIQPTPTLGGEAPSAPPPTAPPTATMAPAQPNPTPVVFPTPIKEPPSSGSGGSATWLLIIGIAAIVGAAILGFIALRMLR